MLSIYISMIDAPEDKNKFELLYTSYRKLLFYIAKKILRDDYLAEDAVHSIFLKVLENMDKINEVNSLKTRSLLVTMTRNHCINEYNRQKTHPMIPLDEALAAEKEVVALEEVDELMGAVLKLSELYRGALTLKYVQGFSDKEIAESLDITETTVRKRLERAKKMVLKILRKEGS